MSVIENSGKTDWISKAKGFAILGVVAVHTIQSFTLDFRSLNHTATAGKYCVQLFFAISAFLTFKSLEKNEQTWTTKSYFRYLAHKILRLVPILYTAVLWHIMMNYPIFGQSIERTPHLWKNTFYALTFLNGFSYHFINPWVNWYIGDLVIFIATSPLLFRWINSVKKSVCFFVVSMVFAWLSNLILIRLGVDVSWYFYFWFPHQLPVLAIGMMFYHFQKGSSAASKNSGLTLAFVVSVCMLLSFFLFKTPMELHVQYGLFLFIFAYTLFNHSGRLFNWLKVLGNNSYGIYLYHWCLIPMFDYVMKKYDVSQTSLVNFASYYVLLVLISLLFAKIATVLFEKPFFRFMKTKFGI